MFFERPKSGERAVLVHVEFADEQQTDDSREFEELVASAGAVPVGVVNGKRTRPHPGYFVGSGKLEEIKALVEAVDAELALFNHALSPTQERNLEGLLQCRVLDRTGLILDIFAQRARTHEGILQVELAQLRHVSTRLVRGWTHLERQKGGIGLRGPGETQLETDRRLIGARIKSIGKKLDKVRRRRDQGRRARKKAELPTLSLVGYTNAGKSTLFNRLTESDVYVADQLFATLDPTLRRIEVENLGPAVLADTVGFIRHLPHQLVEAFRATLQETCEASLLLHVVDAADPERDENIRQVEDVLIEIGAEQINTLMVYNKIDLLESVEPHISRDAEGLPTRVWISAQTGEGVELLLQAICERLCHKLIQQKVRIPAAQGLLRSQLYDAGAVRSEEVDEQGDYLLQISMPESDYLRLVGRYGPTEKLGESLK